MDVVAQRAASHAHTGDGNAGIDALARIGDDSGLRQPRDAVQQRTAMHTQIATIGQLRQDGLRYVPDAELQGGTVLDQHRSACGNRALDVGGRRRGRCERRTRRVDDQIEIRRAQCALAEGPGRLVVHFRQYYTGSVDCRDQVVMRQRKTVPPLGICRCQLQHQHIDLEPAGADHGSQLGVVTRQDVQATGLRQAPIGSGTTVGAKPHAIGERRIGGLRPGRADERLVREPHLARRLSGERIVDDEGARVETHGARSIA